MENKTVVPVVIIGGGPAGLSAALYTSRAGLQPVVFAGSPPGGQLTLTSEVENFPGVAHILGSELIQKMREQVVPFGTTLRDENVKEIDFSQRPFAVTPAGSADPIYARSLIIATGAKALWLGLESEQRLRGKGVSACATCDGFFFRNKVVAVVGGGDTALEDALTLTKFASKVYIIHRRDTFKASKIMQERVIHHEKIEILWNSAVTEILGDQRVTGIQIEQGGGEKVIELQGVFIAIGHKPDTDLFREQLKLDSRGYVLTTQQVAYARLKDQSAYQDSVLSFDTEFQTATSVKGVFAGGDCVDTVYRQASTASGMGVGAALDVEKYLEESESA
ncbi:FAD-dependent oxidoreductase [Candidatus Roizmanbacteria bacterium]|nr:FAD-dependent oxidoreductase [Candidatus Roizmanbacteria bacterium]